MAAPVLLLAVLGAGGCSSDEGPPSGVNQYVEGVNAYHAGQKAEAVAELKEAVAQNPQLRMPHVVLAEIYRGDGDYTHAAEQYSILSQLDPYTEDNHYYLGVCDQYLTRFRAAANAYHRALQLNPTDPRANSNLGLTYVSLGHLSEGLQYLELGTRYDPKSASAWLDYGVGLEAAGRPHDAESAYRKAIELDPKSTTALQDLIVNLISQGRTDEAVTAANQLVAANDSPMSHTLAGNALARAGKYDDAVTQYDAALHQNPNFYPALTQKGFTLIKQYSAGLELDEPKRQSAVDAWQQSLKIEPNQPRVLAAIRQWNRNQMGS